MITDNAITRMILTFLLLHSIHYFATMTHGYMCLDFGYLGYFRTIFTAHSPICHVLLSVSYHAQTNIFQILGLSFISTGIHYLTKQTKGKPSPWETK